MLWEILESTKAKGFSIQQIELRTMTPGGNIAVNSFPEVWKSFHNNLNLLLNARHSM